MQIYLTVEEWAAFAPGLETREAWIDWSRAPHAPRGNAAPALADVPPMRRRRLDALGRMTIQAAIWAHSPGTDVPTVFVSRRGDSTKAFKLLEQLANGELLSPTAFGLSVHNGIAAQYSMTASRRHAYTSLAGGRAGPEAGLIEAGGLLADGAEEVLLVVYEMSAPEPFAEFRDEPDADFAWAWRLRSAGSGTSLRLSTSDLDPGGTDANGTLPHALDVLRFFLSDTQILDVRIGTERWRWCKDVPST